jgi:hypothetical protein
MLDEISEKFEKARGKKAKVYATPVTQGKTLRKNEGTMVLGQRSRITPPR